MPKGRLREMDRAVGGARRILVLTHDHPDPDALASAWALARVLQRLQGGKKVEAAYSGTVGRTENRFMIDILRIPIVPLRPEQLTRIEAIALVDCQPGAGNISLPDAAPVAVVLDHHPMRPATRRVPFHDVRPEIGATATMVAEYLEDVHVRLDRRLATALFHAIRTETQNLGREASRADARQFSRLFPLVDNQALSRIELAPIPRDYFSLMDHAISGTRIYGDELAVTSLGPVDNPDVVAQFADLMVRLEGVRWSMAMGRHDGSVLLSLRSNQAGTNAGRIICRIVGARTSAGGHGTMAAGRVAVAGDDPEDFRVTERRLLRRALEVLEIHGRGVSLVAQKKG